MNLTAEQTSMTTSQTPFLTDLAAGYNGPPINGPTRAYFQQRLRLRIFNFILNKFVEAQKEGLTKSLLARRIEKTPDLINRWLGAPGNLTVDTISDLLLGISAEELVPSAVSPLVRSESNYSHFHELSYTERNRIETQRAEQAIVTTSSNSGGSGGALKASILQYDRTNSDRYQVLMGAQ
jgi:hypothetical protein